jgi:hypothetical protein
MFHRAFTLLAHLAFALAGFPGVAVGGDLDSGTPSPDRSRRLARIEQVIPFGLLMIAALVVGAPPAGVAIATVIGLVIYVVIVLRAR